MNGQTSTIHTDLTGITITAKVLSGTHQVETYAPIQCADKHQVETYVSIHSAEKYECMR